MHSVESGRWIIESFDHDHGRPDRASALKRTLYRVGKKNRAEPLTLSVLRDGYAVNQSGAHQRIADLRRTVKTVHHRVDQVADRIKPGS